jgi:hypothetical protein
MLFLNESTALYLLSAFLQADATIVAILGVFMVFKCQSHQSSIDGIVMKLYMSCDINYNVVTNFEQNNNKGKNDAFKSIENTETIYPYLKSWLNHDNKILEIKNLFLCPLVFTIILLILDTIALVVVSALHVTNQNAEFYLICIIGTLHFSYWVFIGVRVKGILNE